MLVRVDWNVPLDARSRPQKSGLFRIKTSAATVKELLRRKATVILLTHLGRPDGKPVARFSLRHVIPAAEKILHQRVTLLPLPQRVTSSQLPVPSYPSVFLFENLRFDPREEAGDRGFARQFARGADYYVNEAFAANHRNHASVAVLPRLLPSVAGWRLQEEVETLGQLLEKPRHPFVVVLGGAKLSTKLAVMNALLRVCDLMLVGGGIANTMLALRGIGIGASLAERDGARVSPRRNVIAPVWDVVVSRSQRKAVRVRTVNIDHNEKVGKDERIVDVGSRTLAHYRRWLGNAKTILWNGPVGVNEVPTFSKGNAALARTIAEQTARGCLTVVGGGETMDTIDALKLRSQFSFCSTGGGAMLEFLEGKQLPGILPLIKR